MPKVSIVVPVYNVAEYIARTLETLHAQTYSDYEVLCINDGSTDNSLELLETAAHFDSRIKVLTQANAGVSAARNAGLEAATGDIVMFVDSDDLLEPNALQVVTKTFAQTNCDIVNFAAVAFPDSFASEWLHSVLKSKNREYRSFSPKLMFRENTTPFIWKAAYKRELLQKHSVRFDETITLGEDQLFCFSVYPHAKKTVLIKDQLYGYRLNRSASLMATESLDAEKKMAAHTQLVHAVLTKWQALGLLQRYPKQTFIWVLDFLSPDLKILDQKQRAALAKNFVAIREQYFTAEQIAKMNRITKLRAAALSSGELPGLQLRLFSIAFTLFYNPFFVVRRIAVRLKHLKTKLLGKKTRADVSRHGAQASTRTENITLQEDALARAAATHSLLTKQQ